MPVTAPRQPFRHAALLYEGDGDYLTGTVAFIREGVNTGAAVMVAVSAEKIALLAEMLGPAAARVRFADMTELGTNPAQIIPAWRAFVEEHAGRRVRGIGEPIWHGRSGEELVECQLHEALLNVAFADTAGFELLCPYDAATLEPGVLREARRSHPLIATRAGWDDSPDYRGRDAVPDASRAPLPTPPASARVTSFDAGNLREVRALVAECAEGIGLDGPSASDFVLAVHEIATNSLLHGGGLGVLRAWTDGDAAVCEVRDRGHIHDPLVGRHTPRGDQLGGWGLWIANRTCDLVQIRSGPTGTVVRARMRAH